MFLIKRRYSVVNNRQYISLDTNIYGGSVGTVKVGVLDQVGNQYRTKRFIHPDREGTGQMQTTTDFMLSVYIVIKRLPLLDQGNEIDVGALRKLTVIYLGKQQQRFIQPDDMVERTPVVSSSRSAQSSRYSIRPPSTANGVCNSCEALPINCF